MSYDIIIPVASKDVDFLPKVLKYIRMNLIEAENVYIMTNAKCFEKLHKLGVDSFGAVLLDENTMCHNISFGRIKNILLQHGVHIRIGWYLQQFLKMGFAQTKHAKKYYLTWDSDTLPLSHIEFFDGDKPLFTKKKEYNEPYFDTMQKLIGIGKVADFSFISEHMMFDKDIMCELIEAIGQSNVEGTDWIEKILNACENLEKPCFSEFETYGSFVWEKYPGLYGTQRLNTFRAAGIIKGRHIDDYRLERMSLDLDTASFELFDEPLFPYNLSYYSDKWSRRWTQVKSRSFTEMIKFLYNKLRK